MYILLECQSRSGPHMPVRMLQYVAALYDHLLRSDTMDIRDGLPPVLPIVLYNGDARWTHPAELAPLIQPHPPALAPFQPSLRFWLLDQDVWLDARWRGVMAAIFRFEHTRDVDSAKRAIRELAEQIAHSPARRVLDRVLMRWVQHRLNRKLPGIDAIQHHHLIESMDMLETNIDRWKEQALAEGREQGMLLGMQQGMQQGIQQGMASGIEQGRQQGLAQGERQLLQRLLDRRFGPLPDWALARLAHADAAQLEAWSEAMLDAAALSEVLGAPPH
ncbi:Rpn family recombination-promoting nuclease/putative transposase [Rivihabitans pingtungensis]|nr:Rpn family recombination-promoting nuclease/putative transposase [Rivihabitans pingtungensis]